MQIVCENQKTNEMMKLGIWAPGNLCLHYRVYMTDLVCVLPAASILNHKAANLLSAGGHV